MKNQCLSKQKSSRFILFYILMFASFFVIGFLTKLTVIAAGCAALCLALLLYRKLKYNIFVFLDVFLLSVVLFEPSPSDMLFLLLLVFGIISRILKFEKIKDSARILLIYIFYFLACIPGLAYSVNGLNSLRYFIITFYLFLFAVFIFLYINEKNYLLVLRAYVFSSVFAAMTGIIGYCGFFSEYFLAYSERAKGLFKDPNVFGPFLVPAVIILLNDVFEKKVLKIGRRVHAVCLIVITAGIILSFSRAAWINLCAAAFLFLILNVRKSKKLILSVAALTSILSAGLFCLNTADSRVINALTERAQIQDYDQERFAAQSTGLEIACQYPLGCGPGQYESAVLQLTGDDISAHSLYMRVTAENGILGAILFFGAVFTIVIRLFAIHIRGGKTSIDCSVLLSILIGILINSLVVDTLHWRHLWFFIGLSLFSLYQFKGKRRTANRTIFCRAGSRVRNNSQHLEEPTLHGENGKRLSLGKNTFWNFTGKLVYTASRGILLIIIAKLGTSAMVGQYVLALAITAPAFMFADFNLRTVFATDTNSPYQFKNYFGLRLVTTLITFCIVVVIAIAFGGSWDTAAVIILVGTGKSFETISDLLYGIFQKKECMDKLGISLIWKGILSVAGMGAFLLLTHSLIFGTAGLALAWMSVLFLYDYRKARNYIPVTASFNFSVLKKIVRLCLPLGAVLLCISLTSNAPNYLIKGFLGNDSLGYYSSLLYLVTVGDVMVNSLGQTASTRLAWLYADGKRNEFVKLMVSSVGIILAMSLIGLVICFTVGKQILVLFYTQEYGAYRNILILLMCSATFAYLSNLLNYITIAVRQLKIQPVLYVSALIVSIISNAVLLPLVGLKGAAFSAILTNFLLFAGNLSIILYTLIKKQPESAHKKWRQIPDSGCTVYEIRTVTKADELQTYIREWRDILKENKNDIVFIDPDWVIRWWNAFQENQGLYVVLIKRNGVLTGLCPLMEYSKRLYTKVEFLGSPHSIYMDFVIRPEFREQTIEFLTEYLLRKKGDAVFSLTGIPEDSENYILLKNYLSEKKVPSLHTRTVAPFIRISGKDFEPYYQTRYSSHMRKNYKREKKRLSEIGTLVYKEMDAKDIDEIYRLHNQRWKKKLDTSGFSSGRSKAFFSGLLNEKELSFRPVIRTLSLSNQIIAFQYGLFYNGRHLFLRSAHDDLFSMYAPGRMLRKESIRECFLSHTEFCDFGVGYEPYKSAWTDESSNIMTVIFPKKNLLSKILFRFFYCKGKVRSILKRHRFIVMFKRNTLGKVKYFLSFSHIRDKKSEIKSYGLANFHKRTLKNAVRQIYSQNSILLYEKELDGNADGISVSDYTVKMAAVDDLQPLAKIMKCPPKAIVKRFYQTHKCFVAYSAGKIVQYSWVFLAGSGKAIEDKVFNPESGSACIYESYTDQPEAHPSAACSVYMHIQKYLFSNKCHKLYLTAEKKDTGIGNDAVKSGLHPCSRIRTVQLFGKVISAKQITLQEKAAES